MNKMLDFSLNIDILIIITIITFGVISTRASE